MNLPLTTTALLLVMTGCASTLAVAPRQAGVDVDHMLIVAAGEVGAPVAAYAGFVNHGPADKLIGISCACAASVELHTVIRDGGQVRMTNTFPLLLPPGRTEVKPPGLPLHFMLIDTRRPFITGERVPMRLQFERAGTVTIDFVVVARGVEGWNTWKQPTR